MSTNEQVGIGRRAFLRGGTLVLAAGALGVGRGLALVAEEKGAPVLRVGLVTDIHYADRDPQINRFYRESKAKLNESIEHYLDERANVLIELGDLIDQGDSLANEIKTLHTITEVMRPFKGDRFHVFGNHCLTVLCKQEFLSHAGVKHTETFFSFDRGAFHFVVLDACFRADGEPYARGNYRWTDSNIPTAQQSWLRADLSGTTKPTFVFVHQRLDVENAYSAKSAPAVRKILEDSERVVAVFQGHSHKNDYHEIENIHYCTLRAMVEGSGEGSSGYSLLKIFADGSAQLTGFRQQKDYQLKGLTKAGTQRKPI